MTNADDLREFFRIFNSNHWEYFTIIMQYELPIIYIEVRNLTNILYT